MITQASMPKVLFVDDDPDLLEGVTNLLRDEPYRVLTASSGKKALSVLSRHAITVVVSDERMPGLLGSELLAQISREYPHTVRILLTGQASMDAAIRAINEGRIFRFLSKPLSPIELKRNVRDALELAQNGGGGSREASRVVVRQATLSRLEREHPGISNVDRAADGRIIVDMDSLDDE